MVRNKLPMNSWRNCATAVSSDGRRAKVPHNYRGRPSSTSVSISADQDEGINASKRQHFCPSKTSMKELNILCQNEVGSNFYQPRRTIRQGGFLVALEILKMNQTLRYFLSRTPKLASNQLYTSSSNWCQGSHSKLKGTLIEFLTKTNLTETTSIMHMAIKVFNSIFTTAMRKGTIITLLDDSNLNAFQTFWPRLNILRLVGFP